MHIVKTHKFNFLDEMTVENLNFQAIISQVGTYTNNEAKVIASYLKVLSKTKCQKEYKIIIYSITRSLNIVSK